MAGMDIWSSIERISSNEFEAGMDTNGASACAISVHFDGWRDMFIAIGIVYFWNLSLILWILPWKPSFPNLSSTLQPMFQSSEYGVSIKNWRKLGRVRPKLADLQRLGQKQGFHFYLLIFAVNVWLIFFAKVAIFTTLGGTYKSLLREDGFKNLFNVDVAVITLLFISDFFFTIPLIPMYDVASRSSLMLRILIGMVYLEILATFILLCIQWPFLISSLFIGACILLTSFVVGMAVMCLIASIGILGSAFYWGLMWLCWCLPLYYGDYWKFRIRQYSSAFTWLAITYLAWVAGVCLAFLFTNTEFTAHLCLNETSVGSLVGLYIIVLSICLSISSFYIMNVAEAIEWDVDNFIFPNSLLAGFSLAKTFGTSELLTDPMLAKGDTSSSSNGGGKKSTELSSAEEMMMDVEDITGTKIEAVLTKINGRGNGGGGAGNDGTGSSGDRTSGDYYHRGHGRRYSKDSSRNNTTTTTNGTSSGDSGSGHRRTSSSNQRSSSSRTGTTATTATTMTGTGTGTGTGTDRDGKRRSKRKRRKSHKKRSSTSGADGGHSDRHSSSSRSGRGSTGTGSHSGGSQKGGRSSRKSSRSGGTRSGGSRSGGSTNGRASKSATAEAAVVPSGNGAPSTDLN